MTSTVTTAPVAAPSFGTLVAVERRKMIDTRAARWLLAVLAVSTVGLMLAPLLALGSFDQTLDQYLLYSGGTVSLLLCPSSPCC
jgi:ABC-2 type transport system permease protein